MFRAEFISSKTQLHVGAMVLTHSWSRWGLQQWTNSLNKSSLWGQRTVILVRELGCPTCWSLRNFSNKALVMKTLTHIGSPQRIYPKELLTFFYHHTCQTHEYHELSLTHFYSSEGWMVKILLIFTLVPPSTKGKVKIENSQILTESSNLNNKTSLSERPTRALSDPPHLWLNLDLIQWKILRETSQSGLKETNIRLLVNICCKQSKMYWPLSKSDTLTIQLFNTT